MNKCPKCLSLISSLLLEYKVNHLEEVSIDEVKTLEHTETFVWKCPKCGEVLFLTEEEARKFLEGRDGDN